METVPKTGDSWPVIRFNRVDFPVPLSPTIAILFVAIRMRLYFYGLDSKETGGY